MGIDKADIRYVYHYNPAKSLENYAQEVGRAGRDGKPATCEMFFCPDDLNVLENFAYGDTPTQSAVAALVDEVFRQGDDFDVSIYDLSSTHDIRNTVVRTLLTYLELLGHIDAGTPFYAEYQFKPLVSSAEILQAFRRRAKRRFSRRFWPRPTRPRPGSISIWTRPARRSGPRDRVVRALDYLAEKKWLELKTAGVRQRYHMRNRPSDRAALVKSLYDRVLHRESREIQRLRQVAHWVEQDGCQVAALGAHFGDPMDRPCGHCSWCRRGGKPAALPPRPKARDRSGPLAAGGQSSSPARQRTRPAALARPFSLRREFAVDAEGQIADASALRGLGSRALRRGSAQAGSDVCRQAGHS